jgi:hypothetical protein
VTIMSCDVAVCGCSLPYARVQNHAMDTSNSSLPGTSIKGFTTSARQVMEQGTITKSKEFYWEWVVFLVCNLLFSLGPLNS